MRTDASVVIGFGDVVGGDDTTEEQVLLRKFDFKFFFFKCYCLFIGRNFVDRFGKSGDFPNNTIIG